MFSELAESAAGVNGTRVRARACGEGADEWPWPTAGGACAVRRACCRPREREESVVSAVVIVSSSAARYYRRRRYAHLRPSHWPDGIRSTRPPPPRARSWASATVTSVTGGAICGRRLHSSRRFQWRTGGAAIATAVTSADGVSVPLCYDR